MRIIGFNLTKILIEKKEIQIDKLEITQNIDIKDVKREKIQISEKDALKIRFNFSIFYSKDSAKLEFEGETITLPEKKELEDFLKQWKDKKIPEEIRIPLFNFIMNKCNVKALELEDEMSLPLHIPMPRVSTEKQ
tara:strand:- start:79 stop:483 length:405 start_codon:yes stop_codon:yes gene_type:complete